MCPSRVGYSGVTGSLPAAEVRDKQLLGFRTEKQRNQ